MPDNDQEVLGIFAKLAVTLDGLGRHLDRAEKRAQLERLQSLVPANIQFRSSAVIPTPTALTALLPASGDPQLGRIQSLRQIAVGGVLWTTTAAGSAIFIRSPMNPLATGGTLDTTSVVAYAATLPQVAQWGRGEIVLRPNDSLWCVINGGTAAQQYVCSATFWDEEEGGSSDPVIA